MLAATRVKIGGSEKIVNRTTYNISSIKRITRKFLEVSHCRPAKQRQRNVQKKFVFFGNETIVLFLLFSLPSSLG